MISRRDSYYIIDPDFDEDWGASALLMHEIETGTLTLHPDGDRRNAEVLDPVPLHCRGYDEDDIVAKLKIDWDLYLKDRIRWEQEQEYRDARYRGRYAELLAESKARPSPPPQQKPPPSPLPDPEHASLTAGWNYNAHRLRAEIDEHGTLIFNMHLELPLREGEGRVWNHYVMIRITDFQPWQADRDRKQMPEVCRGHGYIIFRRDKP